GLIGGSGVALIQERRDPRLRSAEEVTAALGLPVIGTIPRGSGSRAPEASGQKVLLESRSPVADAYRSVRTAVYWGAPEGGAKTLMITSPDTTEGKSTLTSNLAIAMAMAKERVLVIDADFRNPSQHRIFRLGRDIGLSNLLEGRTQIRQAIQHTAVRDLDL